MRKAPTIILTLSLLLLLSACGGNYDSANMNKSMDKIQEVQKNHNKEMIKADDEETAYKETIDKEKVINVEQVTGNASDQVKEYLSKAEESLAKLKLLQSTNKEAENKEINNNISFLFINKVSALENEETVEDLLAEIETYTELAIESAEEETAVEKSSELLDLVQETQELTVEVYEEIAKEGELTNEEENLLEFATDESESTIEAVDESLAEIEEAVEGGEENVEIDIETEVEDVLEKTPNGPLVIPTGLKVRTEMKINKANKRLKETKAKLIENGIPTEEADKIIENMTEKIKEIEEIAANGDRKALTDAYKAAKNIVKVNKKEIIIAKRLNMNPELKQNIVERAKKLNIPEELISELETLKEEGSFIEAQKLLSNIKKDSFIKASREIRKERLVDKKESFLEAKAVQKQVKSGEITREEAHQQMIELEDKRAKKMKQIRLKDKEKLDMKVKELRANIDPKKIKQTIKEKNNITRRVIGRADQETKKDLINMSKELKKDRRGLAGDIKEYRLEDKEEVKEKKNDINELKENLKEANEEDKTEALNKLKESEKDLKETIIENKKESKAMFEDDIKEIKDKTAEFRQKVQDKKEKLIKESPTNRQKEEIKTKKEDEELKNNFGRKIRMERNLKEN